MRKIIPIITITALTLSCKKESEEQLFKKKISGVWELEKVTGVATTNYLPGNGQIVVFKEDGSYEKRQHDTLLFSGAYSLSTKTDCYPRTNNRVVQTTEGATPLYAEIEGGNLILDTPNCYADGGSAFYRLQ